MNITDEYTNPMKPLPCPCLRGFTLIEVLVVVAIISILMAITIPAMQHARVNSQATASLATMRQLQAALAMYSQNNRNGYPFFGKPGDPYAPLTIGRTEIDPMGTGLTIAWHSRFWASAIAPYLGSGMPHLEGEPIFRAHPDFPSSRAPHGSDVLIGRFRMTHTAFAGPAFWKSDGDFNGSDIHGMRDTQVRYPSNKGILLDLGGPDSHVWYSDRKSARVSFADGSVRAIKWSAEANIQPARSPSYLLLTAFPIMATTDGLAGIDD
ncbi:MAG: type IV pilin protein [Phycisphaerales bacterium]